MKIKIEIELPDDATRHDVENLICQEIFDGEEDAVTIVADPVALEVLDMTTEKAMEVLAKEEYDYYEENEARERELAKRQILSSKAYCNTYCALYRNGTCKYPNVKDCPLYALAR